MKRRVALVRSSLGLRGGDMLALDLAHAAQRAGWDVEFLIDRVLPFAPTTTVPVREVRSLIPATLGGLRRNFLEHLRVRTIVQRGTRGQPAPDLFVVDESALPAVWLKRRFPHVPVLFNCNFPTVPITPPRGRLHAWYRARNTAFNDRALAACDTIAVLSKFSQEAAYRIWPQLRSRPIPILYPGTDLPPASAPDASGNTFLVISRFIPEKRLDLALEAFARLCATEGLREKDRPRLALVGGYVATEPRQAEVVRNLTAQAAAHGLAERVELHFNASREALEKIWARTFALMHTAPEEHFGYTPIEAMARAKPALAVDAGGPAETIIDGTTGALRPLDAEAFAVVLCQWWNNPKLTQTLGRAGREHVAKNFSRERFDREAVALLDHVARGAGENAGLPR